MTVMSYVETPVFFEADGEDLFGLYTRPTGESNGIAALVIYGAGSFPTSGKNQVRARVARELADQGYSVLRMDYRGVADSDGELREASLSDPWVEDAAGALSFLRAQGFERILLVGICFGSVISLASFADIPGVVGVSLTGLPVVDATHREARMANRTLKWYLKRATSPQALRLVIGTDAAAKRRRKTVKEAIGRKLPGRRPVKPAKDQQEAQVSPQFLARAKGLFDDGVPVLMLYGRADAFYPSFERARDKEFGKLVDGAGAHVEVRIHDDALVSMASQHVQDLFVSEISAFGEKVAARQRELVDAKETAPA